jgi:hypothetical protein
VPSVHLSSSVGLSVWCSLKSPLDSSSREGFAAPNFWFI